MADNEPSIETVGAQLLWIRGEIARRESDVGLQTQVSEMRRHSPKPADQQAAEALAASLSIEERAALSDLLAKMGSRT
jgi:hypothetical protein